MSSVEDDPPDRGLRAIPWSMWQSMFVVLCMSVGLIIGGVWAIENLDGPGTRKLAGTLFLVGFVLAVLLIYGLIRSIRIILVGRAAVETNKKRSKATVWIEKMLEGMGNIEFTDTVQFRIRPHGAHAGPCRNLLRVWRRCSRPTANFLPPPEDTLTMRA